MATPDAQPVAPEHSFPECDKRLDGFDSTVKVVSLFHDYGEAWQIERRDSPAAWVAVRRYQPPVLEIHCAMTIDELRAKLSKAG